MKASIAHTAALILIALPAVAGGPRVELHRWQDDASVRLRLYDYRIANNSFLDGLFMPLASITTDARARQIDLQASINTGPSAQAIAAQLTHERCTFIFQIVIAGMRAGLDTTNKEGTPVMRDPVQLQEAQVIRWAPITTAVTGGAVRVTCQGNLEKTG